MKKIAASRTASRVKRHERLRLKLAGTEARPRLAIFRSLSHIYAQVIDDTSGSTLAAASSLEASLKGATGTKVDDARPSASWSRSAPRRPGVDKVVFDRAGFKYHGRVRSLAEAAREAGLDF
jgi:large subunit ribosomal protein L18